MEKGLGKQIEREVMRMSFESSPVGPLSVAPYRRLTDVSHEHKAHCSAITVVLLP